MASNLAQPPAVLAAAIASAGATYNVPPDVLTGIWRRESGSSYPNPYGNAEGYGGLFGTSDWHQGPVYYVGVVNGQPTYTTNQPTPPQEQANFAAAIFHNALVTSSGNLAEANSIYATGRPSGGPASVPGETTFGTVAGYGAGGNLPLPSGASPTTGGSTGATTQPASLSSSLFGAPVGTMEALLIRFGFGLIGVALVVVALVLWSRAVTGRSVVAVGAGFLAGRQEQKRKQARQARETASRQASERRAQEMHEARVSTEKARATELRTRTKHRRRSKAEQTRAEERAYIRGATDQAHHSESGGRRRSR